MSYKQVIIARSDVEMSAAKFAVQVAHASVESASKVTKKIFTAWHEEGAKKVVLMVKGEEELLALEEKCKKLKLPCALISDAGLTELPPGTVTCLGIGPESEDKINKITGSLPLMK